MLSPHSLSNPGPILCCREQGWKLHYVLTLRSHHVFAEASYWVDVSSQPVLSRKPLGDEADTKRGGTMSASFQVRAAAPRFSSACTLPCVPNPRS